MPRSGCGSRMRGYWMWSPRWTIARWRSPRDSGTRRHCCPGCCGSPRRRPGPGWSTPPSSGRGAPPPVNRCQCCCLRRLRRCTPGEPPHLIVTLDLEALRAAVGAAALDYGQQLTLAQYRRLACDCKLVPVVLGGPSEPLDIGRARRSVPLGIRRALIIRDRGCAFPGCDRLPSRCDSHHVIHCADEGDTSLDNCVLLCPTHHREVHHTGWELTIHPDRVEFTPPAILDPQRRPLTNPLRR